MDQPTDAPILDYKSAEIIARPGLDRRLRVAAVGLIFIGFGIWFAYDGFVKYPRENEQARRAKTAVPHNDLSLLLQQACAVALPVGGLALLLWMRHASRGQYRLCRDVLEVPGEPPIDLAQLVMIRIDKRRWKKKGIGVIDYELADGRKGRFTLDDMYYDRKATDAIFQRLEALSEEDDDESPGAEPPKDSAG